jgi:LysM domain
MTSPVDAAEGDPLDGASPVDSPIDAQVGSAPTGGDAADGPDPIDAARDRLDPTGAGDDHGGLGLAGDPDPAVAPPSADRLAAAPGMPPPRGPRGEAGDAVAAADARADVARRNDEPAHARASAPEVVAAICPYLASAGGSWRMAAPSRGHRCLGLAPPTPQPVEKQRRHCLAAEHVECSIFRAARDARATALAGAVDPARIAIADARRRAMPRTAPVLLEPPRLLDQVTRFQLDRTPGQLALVGLMVIAFAFVALSRLSAGSPASIGPSPSTSLIAILPSGSPPTASVRSASPAPSASAGASGSPAASFRTTYSVKKGDTLATIASRFKTTTAAIRTLNNLKSATLHVGQVLKIP